MTKEANSAVPQHFILVPGFWLGAWAWEATAGQLRADGHTVTALTLPGLEPADKNRSSVTLDDQVTAIREAISDAVNSHDGLPLVLVGHSGGGPIAYDALDANPKLVSRIIYVDSGPVADGASVNAELAAGVSVIEFPSWEALAESGSSIAGLTPELQDLLRNRAVPQPAGPARTPLILVSPSRYDVPATVITSSFSKADVERLVAEGHPYFAELAKARPTIIELKTGHWPMLSEPIALAAALEEACLS